jgi:hypothetical protein
LGIVVAVQDLLIIKVSLFAVVEQQNGLYHLVQLRLFVRGQVITTIIFVLVTSVVSVNGPRYVMLLQVRDSLQLSGLCPLVDK